MARVTLDLARKRLQALSIANGVLVRATVEHRAALAAARHALAALSPAEREDAIVSEGYDTPEDRAELLGGGR